MLKILKPLAFILCLTVMLSLLGCLYTKGSPRQGCWRTKDGTIEINYETPEDTHVTVDGTVIYCNMRNQYGSMRLYFFAEDDIPGSYKEGETILMARTVRLSGTCWVIRIDETDYYLYPAQQQSD